jgi:hypothetical protein
VGKRGCVCGWLTLFGMLLDGDCSRNAGGSHVGALVRLFFQELPNANIKNKALRNPNPKPQTKLIDLEKFPVGMQLTVCLSGNKNEQPGNTEARLHPRYSLKDSATALRKQRPTMPFKQTGND